MYSSYECPRDYEGNIIWQESDYVVVAVVKIHFRPHTIRIGSPETEVIKKLSRSLGTELLSYQLRQDSMNVMQQMAQDRLNACNILADSLRNAITKSGLIFSLVKQEIGYLRDQWEQLLLEDLQENNLKVRSIKDLNGILMTVGEGENELREDLAKVQNRFLELPLPPEKGESWVTMQIEKRWKNLLRKFPPDDQKTRVIWDTIHQLKKSLYFGQDPEIIANYNKIPEETKREWVNLIYRNSERFNPVVLEKIIKMLDNPALNIRSRERSKKTLAQLKALAETIYQLEKNTNFLLRQVLNGGDNGLFDKVLESAAPYEEKTQPSH
jgi:hypothetical protein